MKNKCSIISCDKDSEDNIIGYNKKNNEVKYCNRHGYYWHLSEYLYNKEIKELEENTYYIAKKNPFEYLFYILLNFNILSKSNSLYLIYISLIYLLKYIEDIELIKKFIKARIIKENRRIEELQTIRNS